MPKPKPGDRVEIKWLDAQFLPGWHKNTEQFLHDVDNDYAYLLGYLWRFDKDMVVVSMGLDPEGEAGELYYIPRQIVKEINKLEVKRPQ